MKVLVVEDEKLIRIGIISRLENLADTIKQIYEADNGRDALEILNQRDIDIVITDIRMPELDGLELIRACKNRGIPVKFIIISGYAEFNYAKEAVNLGVNSYLLKPLLEADIINAVNRVAAEIKDEMERLKDFHNLSAATIQMQVEKELNRMIHTELNWTESAMVLEKTISPENDFMILVCFEQRTREKKQMEKLYTIIEEEFPKEHITFNNFRNSFQLMVLCFSSNPHILASNTMKYAGIVFTRLVHENLPVTIGVGSCRKSLDSIYMLYSESLSALWKRFSEGNCKLYKFEDYKPDAQKLSDWNRKMKAFQLYLKEGNAALVEKSIHDILDTAAKEANSGKAIINSFKVMIRLISSYATNRGLTLEKNAEDYYDANEYFSAINSIEDLKQELLRLMSRVLVTLPHDIRIIVEEVRKYIMDNYHEKLRASDIAQKHYVNTSYFSEMFKNIIGMGFSDYLAQVRLDNARKALVETDMSIHDVARLVGYVDALYFSKIFSRVIGASPQKYRANPEKYK